MINWHLEVLNIKDLKPHPKNPRQISKDDAQRLESNIKKFGLIDKPIVTKDWLIIGGHQRIKLLKKMKAKTVECWVPDCELSEEDIDDLLISLNKHQGSWDYDIMADQWDLDKLFEHGFSEELLMGIYNDSKQEEKEEKSSSKKKKECPNCGHEF